MLIQRAPLPRAAPLAVTAMGSAAGGGIPALLLHGQPGAAQVWGRVGSRLGAGVRALAVDRPGYGRTGGPAVGVHANAQALLDLLDRLSTGCAVLVAHSWAAAPALALALRAPERVAGLVLVAPVGAPGSLTRLDRVLAVPGLGPRLSGAGLRAAARVARSSTLRPQLAPELLPLSERELRAVAAAWRSPGARRAFSVEQRALVRQLPALTARLAAVTVPTTVLVAADDRVVDPVAQRHLAALMPPAHVVEVAGGHLLPVEQPFAVAEEVTAAVHAAGGAGDGRYMAGAVGLL